MPSGFTATTPQDILVDVGVLYQDTPMTPIGVTRGGLTFSPDKELRNVEFDGKRSNIEQLDRVINHGGTITGTFIELSTTMIPILEPGVTTTTPGGQITTLHTPKDASTLFVAGDYITDLRLTYLRQDATYACIHFPIALVTQYEWTGQDNSEAEIAATFESRLGLTAAASSTDTPSYTLQEIPSIS